MTEHEAAAPTPLVEQLNAECDRLVRELGDPTVRPIQGLARQAASLLTAQAQRIAELEGERDEALRRLGPAMDVHLFRKNIAAVNLPVLVTRYGKPRFVAVAPESYVSPLQLECARGDLADERWHHHHTAEGLRDGNAGLFAKLQAAEAERDEARAGLEKAREALDMAQSALMAAAHRMRHEGFTEAADALDREASAALASLNTTADQGRPVPPHGRGP